MSTEKQNKNNKMIGDEKVQTDKYMLHNVLLCIIDWRIKKAK